MEGCCFREANVLFSIEVLSLEVVKFDNVTVNNDESSDASTSKAIGTIGAECATADDGDGTVFESVLSLFLYLF